MSTEKRFLRALRGQPVDRPPFWFMRQAGRYLPEYREVRKTAGDFLRFCYTPELAVEVTLQPIRRYAMDAAIIFADILLIPDALGQPLRYEEGRGPLLEPIRTADAIPALDIDKLHRHLAPVYETVRGVKAALPAETALIGFAGSPWTVATYVVEGGGSPDHANTKRWAFSDPAGFGRLIGVLETATIEYLRAQADAGAEALQLFDTWAGALPAGEFAKWVTEPTTRIVGALRQSHPDLPLIGFPRLAGLHLVDYAKATGVDAIGLDSTVPPAWAAANLQPICAVQGNLDPQLVVAGGEPMLAAAREIRATLAGGPFIFNLGHGFVPPTPPEHVAALSELLREPL
ncbi:MAG: uroporphyrinogen decarboxylase [Alphaproteobacteria bacterium]